MDSQELDFSHQVEKMFGFDLVDFIEGLNWAILDAELEPLRQAWIEEQQGGKH